MVMDQCDKRGGGSAQNFDWATLIGVLGEAVCPAPLPSTSERDCTREQPCVGHRSVAGE